MEKNIVPTEKTIAKQQPAPADPDDEVPRHVIAAAAAWFVAYGHWGEPNTRRYLNISRGQYG